jgi:hypothetical protein
MVTCCPTKWRSCFLLLLLLCLTVAVALLLSLRGPDSHQLQCTTFWPQGAWLWRPSRVTLLPLLLPLLPATPASWLTSAIAVGAMMLAT